MCFILPVYYTGLCTGRSKIEETLGSFVLNESTKFFVFNGKSRKKSVVIFQSDGTKFDRKRYCTLFLS